MKGGVHGSKGADKMCARGKIGRQPPSARPSLVEQTFATLLTAHRMDDPKLVGLAAQLGEDPGQQREA